VRAGKLRVLAVTSEKRLPYLPDVPTIAESGYPGFEFHGIMLLLAPAGTPRSIIDKLNGEIQSILQEPAVQATYVSSGADPLSGSPGDAAAVIRREVEVNGAIVRELGLSLDE
jgi:tripartite-type tricarboxylate transporter receptor subunit TctC